MQTEVMPPVLLGAPLLAALAAILFLGEQLSGMGILRLA